MPKTFQVRYRSELAEGMALWSEHRDIEAANRAADEAKRLMLQHPERRVGVALAKSVGVY